MIYSYDGINWKVFGTVQQFPDRGAYGIIGSGLLYTWDKVIVYKTYGSGPGYYSYDLYNWIKPGGNFANIMYYDNKLYFRGSVNFGAGAGTLSYSYNGLNWKSTNAASLASGTIFISSNEEIYVASVSHSSLYSIIYSYNGKTWVGVSNSKNIIQTGSGKIIWNGSIFVCTGTKGSNGDATPIAKSYDGINWETSVSPTTSTITELNWNNNVWIISNRSEQYYSYDLTNWTSISSSVRIKSNNKTIHYKGSNLFSSSNSLYRYYGSSTSEFTNIREPQICYGQTTVSADSTVDITNLPYISTSTYFVVAQVSAEPTTYTYGQARKISASSIRLYNQDSATSHTVMWKTIGY